MYTNNELSDNHLSFQIQQTADRLHIEIVADRLSIPHYIQLDRKGLFYVDEHCYHSLFETFKGVLEMIMEQVRLLFL